MMRKIQKMAIKKRPQERGTILVVAIMVVIVMLIIAIPFLSKLSSQSRATVRSAWSLSALNLAEAGVDKCLWKINYTYALPANNPDPEKIVWTMVGSDEIGTITSIKTADNKIIGNELELTVDNVSLILFPRVDNGSLPATQLLESTGNVPFIASNPPTPVKRTVRAYLEEYWKSIWDYGFFVDMLFEAQNQFHMDAYDSGEGPWGGTNSGLDAYFGANSYEYDAFNSFSSGGQNEINGFLSAGGTAAELYNSNPDTYPAPDPSKLNDVIDIPGVDANQKLLMTEEYQLPPVDVYDLPPKEAIPAPYPSVGDWFNESPDYYPDRFNRAPLAAEIKSTSTSTFWAGTHTYNNDGSLTPAESGVYTSFMIGSYGTSGTLTVSGGDVVIYVTALGDVPATTGNAGNFYMGRNSNINIASDSSLTIILGNTSFSVEQGYQINAQPNSPTSPSSPLPAKCVILGTEQFAMPADLGTREQGQQQVPMTLDYLESMQAHDVDALKIPGYMLLEHGQSDGNMYSATYIPRGTFSATGQGGNHLNFFGSLLCHTMNFKTQIDFHYDKALADLMIITGGFAQWKLVSLQEKVPAN